MSAPSTPSSGPDRAFTISIGATPLKALPFGPLTDRTAHICVDMQNIFAEETPWHTPWMERVTLERIDPWLIDLVPPLATLAPPAEVIDKRAYSPFSEPQLSDLLRRRRVDSLLITGAETDVCVLAAVLDAVDLGYRVVLATDALCSSSDATHDALLALYRNRFSQQIETASSETILACWD